jgi:hypothetical protein
MSFSAKPNLLRLPVAALFPVAGPSRLAALLAARNVAKIDGAVLRMHDCVCAENVLPLPSVIPIHTLVGPPTQARVPRELRSDIPPWQRREKPLWTLDEAFEAIRALEKAGAAVTQGELLAVSEDGGVSEVPWEPWLTGAAFPDDPPPTRYWWISREVDEPWADFVARAAAFARRRIRELAGEARTTPAGAIHVDLSWAMEDELALFDVPGWIQVERSRLIEQGGETREWHGRVSSRVKCAGPAVPGSYYGWVAEDLAHTPADARYARVRARGRNAARLAELGGLQGLWAAGCTDRALREIGRLSGLRELFLLDEPRVTSLDPLLGLTGLGFAYIHLPGRVDLRPLQALPALRYLYLHAEHLREFSPLACLTQLNSLHVVPHSVVETFAPLRVLANLRHLSVWFQRVRDGSLAPLAGLRGLRSLEMHVHDLPLEEFARLAAALPRTAGSFRAPFFPADDDVYHDPCWRCGRPALVTIGQRKRILCPECDTRAVQRHVVRWEVARSAAARGGPGAG